MCNKNDTHWKGQAMSEAEQDIAFRFKTLGEIKDVDEGKFVRASAYNWMLNKAREEERAKKRFSERLAVREEQIVQQRDVLTVQHSQIETLELRVVQLEGLLRHKDILMEQREKEIDAALIKADAYSKLIADQRARHGKE